MKTKKYHTKTILSILFIIVFTCCEKNKNKDYLLQNEWKIKSVTIGNKTLKPPSKTLREEAYILKFSDNSCFLLATSMNYAGGKYQIVSDKNIIISNYGDFTKVGGETDFDKHLLNMLTDVTNFSCKSNKLTFLTDNNNKIVFDKK